MKINYYFFKSQRFFDTELQKSQRLFGAKL